MTQDISSFIQAAKKHSLTVGIVVINKIVLQHITFTQRVRIAVKKNIGLSKLPR
ncbi:hypothetical protein D030_3743A, partial [Vibrio parahaemolyticus AQ3810]